MRQELLYTLLTIALATEATACNTKPTISPTPEGQRIYTPTPLDTRAAAKPTHTPTLTPTLEHACQKESVILKDTYKGKYVPKDIPLLVYLPSCYDTNHTYPVLYLLHGKPFDQNHWVSLGIQKAADTEINNHIPDGFIIVMPDIPEPLFTHSDGGPQSYEAEMTENLIPFIENRYNVSQSPTGRAIGGISRGGVWSLKIGLRHPELFGTVIALSPALAVNYARPAYNPYKLTDYDQNQNIFLAAGETDWARLGTLKLSNLLTQKHIEADVDIVTGAHEAITWEHAIPNMLRFTTDQWSSALGYTK